MFPHTTTDKFIMAERIRIGLFICIDCEHVFRSSDIDHYLSDYY